MLKIDDVKVATTRTPHMTLPDVREARTLLCPRAGIRGARPTPLGCRGDREQKDSPGRTGAETTTTSAEGCSGRVTLLLSSTLLSPTVCPQSGASLQHTPQPGWDASWHGLEAPGHPDLHQLNTPSGQELARALRRCLFPPLRCLDYTLMSVH